jgi:small GTP-binding protein
MATNSNTNQTKILIMGLDNSGKTSIVLSLSKDTNLLSYFSLKPTQGLKISNLQEGGSSFSIWDFGGQEQYRNNYLQEIDAHFKGADRFIFVIDVQDEDRYATALGYLETLVKSAKINFNSIEMSIFLHKYDPPLEMHSTFNKKVDDQLIKPLKKILPPSFKCKIFKTSIYTIFKKTLAG